MAVINLGTATSPVFFDFSIIPGVTEDPAIPGANYSTGAHTFNLGLDSNIYVSDIPGSGQFGAGFLGFGSSVWTLNINGTIDSTELIVSGGADTPIASAVLLMNGGLASGLSRINVGAEGGLYGNFSGIFSYTAATVTNAGSINGGFVGIYFSDRSSSSITSNLGLSATGAAKTVTVTNAAGAEISGESGGIDNDTESNLVVTNNGTISGGYTTYFYDLSGNFVSDSSLFYNAVKSGGVLTLNNTATGQIDGTVTSSWLGSSVVNAGEIGGTISSFIDLDYISRSQIVDVNRDGDFTDAGDLAASSTRLVGLTVTNTGVIYGGARYLVFEQASANDPNVIIQQPYQVTIDSTQVRDVITNAATGAMFGEIYLNGGSDSLSNAGVIQGTVYTGSGDDVFNQAATGRLIGTYADSSVGAVLAISTSWGNDTVSAAGTVDGAILAGEGHDVLTISGTVNGIVWADIGPDSDRPEDDFGADIIIDNDVMTVAAAGKVNGFVYLGEGNNSFTNNGVIDGTTMVQENVDLGLVVAGAGNDSLTNNRTGTIYGTANLGDGNNTISNAGNIFSDERLDLPLALLTGNGRDRLTNSGTIGFETPLYLGGRAVATNLFVEYQAADDLPPFVINMGDGADTLTNTGRIYGAIDLGMGDDSLTGGNFNEAVIENSGADVYRLGGGADAVIIFNPDESGDLLDGGAGLDLMGFYDLESTPSVGHRIDLAAGRITYFVVDGNDTIGMGLGDSLPQDTITGFEQVIGSSAADVIIGGSAAETLVGGDGNDTITGGLGRDSLVGGDGEDVFVFNLATESGRTRSTRDVISDFVVGEDKIELNFDSNTSRSAAGVQDEFTFIGMNAGFTGTSGAVRAYWQSSSTIVEVDTNGDRRADFSLELIGRLVLDSGSLGLDF